MIHSLCKKCSWCNTDSALLVLRIGVGALFIYAGWGKVSDLPGTVAFFGTIGFVPFWAYLVAFVELLGGIAVLLGGGTRVAAALLSIIMLVAIYKTWGNPQMMTPLSVLISTLALKLGGGGKYSLMKKCCGSKGSCGCVGE